MVDILHIALLTFLFISIIATVFFVYRYATSGQNPLDRSGRIRALASKRRNDDAGQSAQSL
ncbi:MAG: hypothetical protein IPL01_21175 [Acidobacteria bacterium]|nr:hypothetical protein [Acidobacteriota bacterium]